jgi:pSer/pThr/pTyr-binding forkhead associated (FHA) protein
MTSKITPGLRVPPFVGVKFVGSAHHSYVVGRGEDCDIRLPSGGEFHSVSRHHCLLDVNVLHVGVRDCGSSNGTFVNGVRLSSPDTSHTLRETLKAALGVSHSRIELKDGDELRVGRVTLKVCVVPSPGQKVCVFLLPAHSKRVPGDRGLNQSPMNAGTQEEELRWMG